MIFVNLKIPSQGCSNFQNQVSHTKINDANDSANLEDNQLDTLSHIQWNDSHILEAF